MPAFVDVDAIAKEGLVDCISIFRFKEIDGLSDQVRRKVKIGTRYRWDRGFPHPSNGFAGFTEEQYQIRQAEAKKRGIKTGCVKKSDIARQLPPDVLEKLASK